MSGHSAEKDAPTYGPCNAECNGCPECDPGLRPDAEKDVPEEARCCCGMHAKVFGDVPDPGCPIHGDHGVNAWSTCWACGRNVRHAVGHACEASDD